MYRLLFHGDSHFTITYSINTRNETICRDFFLKAGHLQCTCLPVIDFVGKNISKESEL